MQWQLTSINFDASAKTGPTLLVTAPNKLNKVQGV